MRRNFYFKDIEMLPKYLTVCVHPSQRDSITTRHSGLLHYTTQIYSRELGGSGCPLNGVMSGYIWAARSANYDTTVSNFPLVQESFRTSDEGTQSANIHSSSSSPRSSMLYAPMCL